MTRKTYDNTDEHRLDPTETDRRRMIRDTPNQSRGELEALHGDVWDTQQLQELFVVTGFMAPFVGVTRKSDGATGSCMFQGDPRFYHSFAEAG